MERKVDQRRAGDFLSHAVDGLGQRLVSFQGIGAEGDEGGKSGAGCRQSPQFVVVMPIQMDVGVDQARQNELAFRVDVFVRGRK